MLTIGEWMVAGRLHVDEVEIDAGLVQGLLAAQFPRWAGLPLVRVPSAGTDNALFRLGPDLVVRLPRVPGAGPGVVSEQRWLSYLAPRLPLEIPAPLGRGRPAPEYPGVWSVQRWIEGRDAVAAFEARADQRDGLHRAAAPDQFAPGAEAIRAGIASDLGNFVRAMQRIDPSGGPTLSRRGLPLVTQDAGTRSAISELRALGADAPSTRGLDLDAALATWEAARSVPDWSGPPRWFHGDLLPGNLLLRDGRLSAVIDFGCMGVGDPACDAMAGWTVLSASTREIFRTAARFDSETWARGRGWALVMGLIALPYYRFSNPTFARVARRAIDQALADR